MLDVVDALNDPRYHPLVDQLVLDDTQMRDASTHMSSTGKSHNLRDSVNVLSIPLMSNEGRHQHLWTFIDSTLLT